MTNPPDKILFIPWLKCHSIFLLCEDKTDSYTSYSDRLELWQYAFFFFLGVTNNINGDHFYTSKWMQLASMPNDTTEAAGYELLCFSYCKINSVFCEKELQKLHILLYYCKTSFKKIWLILAYSS